uniref:Protein FAM107B n=1 Tax=Tabanus bromius TaxID=304241 RepID=A0A0K8TNX6_TABBR
MMPPLQPSTAGVVTDSKGLIVPKKILNPCLESSDRQNLHRELMFNQKIGKNVLNQKSELQRALEKQKERQFMQQHANNESGMKNELNRVIMERAQRIEKKNVDHDEIDNQLNPEYLNARARLRTRVDSK